MGTAGLFSAGLLLPNRHELELLLLRLPNVSFGVSVEVPNRLGAAVEVLVVDAVGLLASDPRLLKKEPSVEVDCADCCWSVGLPKSPKPVAPVDVVVFDVPKARGFVSAVDLFEKEASFV